jgi:predicted phage terminase large subunit-like protein
MHVADLVGRLLDAEKNGGDKWHVVKLAADPDNPPWPQRYHRVALERLKMNTESRQWNALYMQEPVPAGGGEFKRDWIEWYNEAPTDVAHNCNRYILIDPASGRRKDKDNDFTSMWVIGCAEDRNYYVLDLVRDKLTLTERATTLIKLHRKWKPYQVRYEHIGMQGDIEFIRELQRQQNYRFSITEVGGTVEKNTRIRRLIPLFERGRVWLPHTLHRTQHDGITRNLIEQFIEEELLAFPGPRHDDALDALARIAEPDLSVVWPKGDEQDEDKRDRYSKKSAPRTSPWAAI